MYDGKVEVLLVEDDPDGRLVTTIALKHLGFEVETAAEGMEALEVLDERTPDVIMLDLRMPGMSGWQFLEHYTGNVPIVIVSAWWDDQPLARDVFAVISKPADMREVAVMLRQAARSRGSVLNA